MKKKGIILIASLIMAMSVGAGVGILANGSNYELPDVANVGETYDIPEYTYDSQKATARVVTPDGSVFNSNKLTISTYGVYKVEYVVDGVVVKTHETVANMRPMDLFTTNSLVSNVSTGSYSYSSTTPKFKGVQFDIRSGAKIEYNNVIDFTNKTKDDILTQFIVKPNEKGSRDFGRVVLTYTDVEDPNSYFEMVLSAGNLTAGNSPANSYLRGAATNQKSGGWEGSKFNTGEFYGSPVLVSFSGEDNGIAVHNYAMSLYYDYSENSVYAYWYGTKKLVVDFDDPAIQGSNVWSGFKSGKAKLSVTFDKFLSNNGHIIFTEIDGVDLSTKAIKDIVPPEINIDLKGEKTAPNSYVGAKYPVFDCTTRDFFDMDCDLDVKVLYNDSIDEKWYNVSVENGYFITDKIGNYKIVYKAVDDANNVSEKTVSFVCLNEKNEIAISGLASEQECSVFDKLVLNDTLNISGGNGSLSIFRKVTSPSGKEVKIKDDTLIPEEIGDYKVKYTVTDFFGNTKETESVIHAKRIDGAKFVETPKFPNVMITDFTYELPTAKAVVCDGDTIKDAVVEIYVNGEKTTAKEYKISSDAESVVFEYKAIDLQSNTYSLTPIEIPVIKAEKGKKQDAYFYDKDGKVSAEETDSSIVLSFNENGGIQFANVLNRDYFEIDFVCDFAKLNFATMKLRMVDSENEKVSQTILVDVIDGSLVLSTNDAKFIDLNTKVSLDKNTFSIGFDTYTKTVKDLDGYEISKFTIDDNGNEFTGFTKGLNLFIEFEGVKGESSIEVSKINNQYFGYSDISSPVGDKTQPEIVYNGVYKTRAYLGETVKVYSADVYDVLNQIASKTVTVYSPSGTKLIDEQPISEDYEITVNESGNYKVIYNVKDTVGNEMKYRKQIVISVVDNVAPVLEVTSTYKGVYKVGSVIELPKFTISDNNGNALCDIMVQLPDGEVRFLSHYDNGTTTSYLSKGDDHYSMSFKASDTSFVLEEEGKYIITVLGYDGYYNYVKKTFVFYAVK